MNVIQQIKRSVVLLSIGIMPLCASENTRQSIDLRLVERQRLSKEIDLERDAKTRQKKLKKDRREQSILAYDDTLEYVTVLQPSDLEKFRMMVK